MRPSVPVWSLWVRLLHWALAATVIANLFFLEEGESAHNYVGYGALGVVVVRLIWGLRTRDPYARLQNFFPTPSRLKHQLQQWAMTRKYSYFLGHSPWASVAMFGIWAAVCGLAFTGFLMGTDRFFGEEWVELAHEWFSNGLMALLVIHLAGIFLEMAVNGYATPLSMIHGKKPAPIVKN